MQCKQTHTHTQADMFVGVQDEDTCHLKVLLEAAAICNPTSISVDDDTNHHNSGSGSGSGLSYEISTSGVVIILVLAVLLLYCIGGAYVKHKATGATGIETLPHIDTCRRVCQVCLPSSFLHTIGLGGGDYYRYSSSHHGTGYFDDTDFMFDGDVDSQTIEFNNW